MSIATISRKALREEQGFNLIEAAIVLGIVGIVIGGIWIAASMTFESLKQQSASKGLLSMSDSLKTMYNGVPTGTAIDTVPNLISTNAIPADWQNGAAAAKSPFGGAVTIGGTVGAATITLAGLTKAQCMALVNRIGNSRPSPTLRSINGGGTAVTNGGAGTAGFGSITAASAAGACPTASNSVVFTFDLSQ